MTSRRIVASSSPTSALLVPRLTAGADRDRNRAALATELVNHAASTRRALNQLQVALSNCYQDHADGAGVSADDRNAIRSAHREFDALAWWEHSNILFRAKLVDAISPREEQVIQRHFEDFKKALNQVSPAISPIWDACVKDPRQLEGTAGADRYEQMRAALGPVGRLLTETASRAAWELSVRR